MIDNYFILQPCYAILILSVHFLNPVAQEFEKIKQELDESKVKQKELTSANVKLNGMLKTGYDSLKVEQENVRVLQQQLSEKSSKVWL